MLSGDGVAVRAIAIAVAGQRQQRADLIEQKAQIARAADEGQPGHVIGAIAAIIASGSYRAWRKPSRFSALTPDARRGAFSD